MSTSKSRHTQSNTQSPTFYAPRSLEASRPARLPPWPRTKLTLCPGKRTLRGFATTSKIQAIRTNQFVSTQQNDTNFPTHLGKKLFKDDPDPVVDKKRDMRSLLKAWQPPPDTPAGKMEPLVPVIQYSRVVNNLTRPESEYDGNPHMHDAEEQLSDQLRDFNRITDMSDGATTHATMLKRGDLVELRNAAASPLLAVFLRISDNSYYQFYTSDGKLFSASYRTPQFQIDNFFNAEELEPIMKFIPKATNEETFDGDVEVPRTVSNPVLKKISDFRTTCDNLRRKYSSAIEKAHEKLAHPTEIRFMALEDIVAVVTKLPYRENKPYPEELVFTISNALVNARFGFTTELRTFASTRIVTIQPKENIKILQRTQKRLRAYQEQAALIANGATQMNSELSKDAEIVKAFARKCHRLIWQSRQLRRYSKDGFVISCNKGSDPPATQNEDVIHSLKFSDHDREFLRVLKLHTLTNAIFRHPTYRSMASTIVRIVLSGMPNIIIDPSVQEEFREDKVWNFLVEIGVVDPFGQGAGFDTEVWPPNARLSHELGNVEKDLARGEAIEETAKLVDSMGAFRTDWEEMPCFCIDSASTHEIDDGISLSEVPGEPGNHWLRIHVSHISAFTTPEHILGRAAEYRQTSLYTDMGASAMLPRWATEHFSIASNRPCITYSAKLNSEGEMLDYKVEPGILRNVLYMTPEMVDDAFGRQPEPEERRYDMNLGAQAEEPPIKEASRPLTTPTEEHMKILRKMRKLLEKVRSTRVKSRMMTHNSKELMSLDVSHIQGEVMVAAYTNPTHAQFCTKDPVIKLSINKDFEQVVEQSEQAASDVIVEQSMLQANVVAARWAHDRKIPIIYTGTRPAVEGLENITELTRQQLMNTHWSKNIVSKIVSLYAIRYLTSYPHEQKIMGVDSYAKLTSPLRRFMDFVSNWQIDAALREEHRTGVSLAGRPDVHAPFLPYQRSGIELVIRLMNSRLQDIQWWQGGNRKHWQCQALARAFYLGETELPETFTCLIQKGKFQNRTGTLNPFNVLVNMDCGSMPEGMALPVEGEVWEVKLEAVNLYTRGIAVEPLMRLEGIDGEQQ